MHSPSALPWKANLDNWRQQVERSIGNELTRTRTQQLNRLQSIFERAVTKLENDVVLAKSWEGVAAVLVKLAELLDNWRDKIKADSVPQIAGAFSPPSQTRPKLTDEEARAAAMLILQRRREQMRLDAARQNADQGENPEPELKLIEGRKDS